jgi:hypothetical protein
VTVIQRHQNGEHYSRSPIDNATKVLSVLTSFMFVSFVLFVDMTLTGIRHKKGSLTLPDFLLILAQIGPLDLGVLHQLIRWPFQDNLAGFKDIAAISQF